MTTKPTLVARFPNNNEIEAPVIDRPPSVGLMEAVDGAVAWLDYDFTVEDVTKALQHLRQERMDLLRSKTELGNLLSHVEVLQTICAEAYQVIGSLASDLDVFDVEEVKKILDNLSHEKIVHDDILPWPLFKKPL